jgi:glucan endo-1,3-alpha-glucosidase
MKLRLRRTTLVRVLVCACALVLLLSQPMRAQRMVFAHYMLTNQDYQSDDDPTQERKIAAYEREIKQTQSLGIDGFALNAGGWLHEPYYIRYAAQMFEAAARLNSGFKLMFSADMCCGNGIDDVEDMMRRFAGNPRYASVYFRYKDRFVLTTFAGGKLSPSVWQQIRNDLAYGTNPSTQLEPKVLPKVSGAPSNKPLPIFLVPAFFWGGELPAQAAIQQGFNTWQSTIDGSFYWGIAGVPGTRGALDQTRSSNSYASVVHAGHKLYMAPICLQFWGANANRYYEYGGASGMRAMWMDAINVTRPEWVELITWNDFIEGTYISPIDDPNKYPGANFLNTTGVPLNTQGYFHSHAGATALLPFFIQWYKTGKEPAITRDEIFHFYRTQPKAVDAGAPPIANKFGPVEDVIYITANLTAPADLSVTTGGRTSVLHLAAGSSDSQAPFSAGDPPTFTLKRGSRIIATGRANDPIEAAPKYNNFYYSTGTFAATPQSKP